MGKWRMLLAAAVAALTCAAAIVPARAADMGLGAPPAIAAVPGDAAARIAAAEDYLRRRAVLLLIRATFNLLADDEVPRALEADAARIGANGPGEGELARLDRDLLAEGSYYLVSLRYLAELGGAAWPGDRPESSYANDALVRLDVLQDQLLEAVETRSDPLPIFAQAQDIMALSEGFAKVPARLERFARRDAIVERVLAGHGPRTSI
ncbi:MAG: hypothetical protein Q8L54_02925 [Devosia sp.]|nr:hypothetical protein [Devosia sp.]